MAALVAGACIIGVGPILVRVAVDGGDVQPVSLAFWRMAAGLLPLTVVLGCRGGLAIGAWPPWAMAAGAFLALDLAVWHWSIVLTSVANATLLSNLAPVFVTLGGVLLFGQRVGVVFLLGLVSTLGGALLLCWPRGGPTPHVVGDALGACSAVFYGTYLLGVSRLRRTWDTLPIMFASSLGAAPALLVAALARGEDILPHGSRGWMIALTLGLLVHLGGQGLITYALAHLSAAFSSVTLLVQPVVAAALAWWWLSQDIGWTQGAGAAVIIAGIVVARRGSPARDRA